MNIQFFSSAFRLLSVATLCAGALSSTAPSAQAEVITSYWQNDAVTTNPPAPHDYVDGVSPSNLVTHGSIAFDPNLRFYGLPNSLDTVNYVGFTVAADQGISMTVTSLDFKTIAYTNPFEGTMDVTSYRWGYRVNDGAGFGAWSFDKTYTPADPDFANQFTQKTWDFADFTTPGAVEFGLFSAKTTTGFGYMAATFDRINVNGSTSAVPEPSTYALIVVAGVAVMVVARRRKLVVTI